MFGSRTLSWILALTLLGLAAGPSSARTSPAEDPVFQILQLLSRERREATLELLREHWQPQLTPMILEILRVSSDRVWNARLMQLLQQTTGRGFLEYELWWEWHLGREAPLHPTYHQFKAALYGLVDPAFRDYFSTDVARLRLDAVRWSGLAHGALPPLDDPTTVAADAAGLAADDPVYGLVVGGEARAYPRRAMRRYQVVNDTLGGEAIAVVLSPLAGAVHAFRRETSAGVHRFAASAFLVSSIQLLRDESGRNLWHPVLGGPVVGPLAAEIRQLDRLAVTVTPWAEWRRRHPTTRVVSLAAGEGEDPPTSDDGYLDDDKLLFSAGVYDQRLANKEPVVGLVALGDGERSLAMSKRFLSRHPIFHDHLAGRRFVALTDAAGATRIYAADDVVFAELEVPPEGGAVDNAGGRWQLSEGELRRGDGRTLARWPSQRLFWFAWYATFEDTRLIDTYSRD